MADLNSSISIASYGMKAQSARIKVISENIANADTAALSPTQDPYTRKTITFKNVLDRQNNVELPQVDKITQDHNKPFQQKYMPDHPGADANGMVKMPNVDPLVELTDMREAQRSYEANLGMVEQSRTMMGETIDILKH